MRKNILMVVSLLALCLTVGPAAFGQTAMVNFTGGGAWAGLTEFTVPVGTTVPLVLDITDAVDLAYWEVHVRVNGSAGALAAGSHDTWWETPTNVVDNTVDWQDTTQSNVVLGAIDFFADPPYSYSGSGSLANLEFECTEPGDVVVTILTEYPPDLPPNMNVLPGFSQVDPVTGFGDLGNSELPVEFSSSTVTIHQTLEGQRWDFFAGVAPGDETMGYVDPAYDDTYDDGFLVDLWAIPNDPVVYVFSHWEETTGAGVPYGDPTQAHLAFPLHSDLELYAHFVLVPEPCTLTLMGLGLACVGLRRRRRRRA